VVPFAEGVELRFYFDCCGGWRQGEGFVMVWCVGLVGESSGEGSKREERCCERRYRSIEADEANCRSEWWAKDHGGGGRAFGVRE
jgi:hypothetical protein